MSIAATAERLTRMDDLRRGQVVAIAQRQFFANGFAGTAMSAIAAELGGSKTTLWKLFPSKYALFAAVVDDIVERYGRALEIKFSDAEEIGPALKRFGVASMSTVLSRPILDLQRLVVGEAGRFPELGRLFYERGSKRGKAKLGAFIGAAMEQGKIREGDPMVAAREFVFLCQSNHHYLRLLGVVEQCEQSEVAADVERAVDTFMRAWGVQGGGPAAVCYCNNI